MKIKVPHIDLRNQWHGSCGIIDEDTGETVGSLSYSQHFWNPQWRTSLYGGYAAVSYNSLANANICERIRGGNGTGTGTSAVATPGCSNDWSTWWLGSRTQWNVTKDFYTGFDVLYAKLNSASTFSGLNTTNIVDAPGVTNVADTDNWQFRFRVHRDFYP